MCISVGVCVGGMLRWDQEVCLATYAGKTARELASRVLVHHSLAYGSITTERLPSYLPAGPGTSSCEWLLCGEPMISPVGEERRADIL